MDELTPNEIGRRINGNQPHPGQLVTETLQRHGITNTQAAADVLAELQRHYELRPR